MTKQQYLDPKNWAITIRVIAPIPYQVGRNLDTERVVLSCEYLASGDYETIIGAHYRFGDMVCNA